MFLLWLHSFICNIIIFLEKNVKYSKIHTLAKVGVVVTIFDNKTFSFFYISLIMTGFFF